MAVWPHTLPPACSRHGTLTQGTAREGREGGRRGRRVKGEGMGREVKGRHLMNRLQTQHFFACVSHLQRPW